MHLQDGGKLRTPELAPVPWRMTVRTMTPTPTTWKIIIFFQVTVKTAQAFLPRVNE